MPEVVGNLHLHTTASDGSGTHNEVASAAARAGLDFIIYTDHNTWVDGIEGWYHDPYSNREILRLMGQEVNDESLEPERNHMLCLLVNKDLQLAATDPQCLIDTVEGHGGVSFLAHPLERPGVTGVDMTYPWVSWDISGYTGVELWNTMTDAKWRLRTIPRGIIGGYIPHWVITEPFPEMLAKWDELCRNGQKVVAVGSTDAHAMVITWKIITRNFYPYEFLFRTVNTHLLLADPLSKDVDEARQQVRAALALGHCFVGYDLPASTRGFSFTGSSGGQQVIMGDTLTLQNTATLTVSSPRRARLRLLKDGQVIAQTSGKNLAQQIDEPGVYRVEAYRYYWGWRRGWVYTNPIYVRT
jgi:hypothetical protein